MMILKIILIIFIIGGVWSLTAYVLYRVGLKLNVKKIYYWYLIPFYNVWILAKRVDFSAYLFSLFLILPIVNTIITEVMKANLLTNIENGNEQSLEHSFNLIYAMGGVSSLIFIILGIKLWGDIAKTLGKNFWLYGIFITFLVLPVFILAFDDSKVPKPEPRPRPKPKPKPNIDENDVLQLESLDFNQPSINLKKYETKRLGRDTSNNVVIDNKYLSSKHIEIYAQESEVFITDLGSTNGTYIDGIKLKPQHPTKLDSDKKLILGSEDVVYQLVRRF